MGEGEGGCDCSLRKRRGQREEMGWRVRLKGYRGWRMGCERSCAAPLGSVRETSAIGGQE